MSLKRRTVRRTSAKPNPPKSQLLQTSRRQTEPCGTKACLAEPFKSNVWLLKSVFKGFGGVFKGFCVLLKVFAGFLLSTVLLGTVLFVSEIYQKLTRNCSKNIKHRVRCRPSFHYAESSLRGGLAGACQRLTGVPLASGALSVFGVCGFLRKFCGILRVFAEFCGFPFAECCGIFAEFRGMLRNFADKH